MRSARAVATQNSRTPAWLGDLLTRNAHTAYLRRFGAPRTLDDFRQHVPLCTYEDLAPDIARIETGEADVLFAGRPVAYERTGGSTRGPKLIPYSREGLADFRANLAPWLLDTLARHEVRGLIYFSISPATRKAESIGGVPVGLPDGAYVGEDAARHLMQHAAVPASIADVVDVDAWRTATLEHLAAARDLEFISVWSPTFLLRMLDSLPDPVQLWPRLKVVSCWASGPSRRYAAELAQRLPQARIEPKGLLSTECAVTVPDAGGCPVLVEQGFFEFVDGDRVLLEEELQAGHDYEVIVTTASGLYRYRTGDIVRCARRNARGCAILDFIGRDAQTCDLTGEKLTESFVSACVDDIRGYAMLVPSARAPGYVLVCEREDAASRVAAIESRLLANPQYAYSRKLGQLAPLRALICPDVAAIVERALIARGTRLGDIKPLALRSEPHWLALFTENAR